MPRAPHLLWIVTTQWRAQACGYAGDVNARTPHLDAFAARAANFAQAVTPHPFGPFARAALLTGVPSPENGIRDYFDPLPIGGRTIAHELSELGYATAFFGKWHLARRDPAAPLVGEPHARMIVPSEARGGFAWWEGFESGFLLNDPWLQGSGLAQPTQFPGYQSDVVCGRAADWLRAQRGERGGGPWFAMVSVEPPHPPYGTPAAGERAPDPARLELPVNVPRGGEVEARARRELSGYYAHIAATDRAIGRLLAAVSLDDTVVVITSVHGDMHGAHGLFRKGWPHEESVRVPLLVSVPATHGGSAWRGRRTELASLIDLPGWARRWGGGEAFAVPAPEHQLISMPSVVALPHQCDRVWRGIRTAARKLILAPAPTGAGAEPWLFFDLEQDPAEDVNLAGDPARRSEVDALRRRFER